MHRLFVLIFIAPGLFILYLGYHEIIGKIEHYKVSKKTIGKVIEFKTWEKFDSKRAKNSIMYSPIVKYKVPNSNEEFTHESNLSTSDTPDYEIGEEVEILYNPEAPHDAYINSYSELLFGPFLYAILGFSFTGVGLIFLKNSFDEPS
jgi:hypothetical protein